jgi:type II secretory pathway pseudopilin PulG
MEMQLDTLPSAPPAKSPSATPRLSNQRGFTLVEAVVAMMICTVGMIAMAELLAVSLRMQQLGRNSTSAARVAQDKIDELSTVGFDSLQMACAGSLSADEDDHNDDAVWADGTRKGFRRRWVVSAAPDAALVLPSGVVLGTRQVTVRVFPENDDRRVTQQFDLTTVIRGTGAACP